MMLMVNKDGSSTVIARRYCLGASRNTCPGDLSRVFHQYLKMEKGKVSFSFSTGRRRPFWWFPPRGFFFYWKKRDAFAADAIAAVDFLRRRRAWSINALASSLFRSVRPSIDWWGRIRQHVPRPHGALEKLCQRLKKIWWRLKGVEWKGAPNHGALILALFSASPPTTFFAFHFSSSPHTHTRC